MRRWLHAHPTVKIIIIAVLIAAPGYARQEKAIGDAKDAARTAQAAVDLVIAQRTEAREVVCGFNQGFAQAHNALVLALATGAGSHPVRPEDQAAVDENTVPVPDCTPRGIADFYAGRSAEQQPDGAVGGTKMPSTTTTTAPTTTVRRTTTTTPSTTTTRPPSTSTTFRSSPTTTRTPCVVPIPLEIPCPL